MTRQREPLFARVAYHVIGALTGAFVTFKLAKTDVLIFSVVVLTVALIFLAITNYGQFGAVVDVLKTYGYFGGFVLGILSAFTLFIPSPAFIAVAAMATFLDPLMLGIAAGIGSGIGEMTAYIVGRGAEAAVHKRKGHIHKSIVQIDKLFKRYHPDVVIFGFSAIPVLPVDAVGIFCGLIRYNWKRFLIVMTIGKIIKYTALAFLGATFFGAVLA